LSVKVQSLRGKDWPLYYCVVANLIKGVGPQPQGSTTYILLYRTAINWNDEPLYVQPIDI
jgi:hypothetical protein